MTIKSLGVCALVLVAACSSSGKHPAAVSSALPSPLPAALPSPLQSLVNAAKAAPSCDSLVTGTVVAADVNLSCRNGDTLEATITYPCNNGRTLIAFGNDYWGVVGQHAHKGNVGSFEVACRS